MTRANGAMSAWADRPMWRSVCGEPVGVLAGGDLGVETGMVGEVVLDHAVGHDDVEPMAGLVQLQRQNPDDLLADALLDRVRDAVRERRRPRVLDGSDAQLPRLVSVARRDEPQIAS